MEPQHIEDAYEMFRHICCIVTTFLRSPMEDDFFPYRQHCPRSNRNLVATEWILSQRNDYAPKLRCKRQYFILDLHFLALCQDSPISMMSSAEQRDVARHIREGQINLLHTKDLREELSVQQVLAVAFL